MGNETAFKKKYHSVIPSVREVQERHSPRLDRAAASSGGIGVGRSTRRRHFADVNLAGVACIIRAVAHDPLSRKHSLPRDTLQERLGGGVPTAGVRGHPRNGLRVCHRSGRGLFGGARHACADPAATAVPRGKATLPNRVESGAAPALISASPAAAD